MLRRYSPFALLLVSLAASAAAGEQDHPHDGRLFDPGVRRTAPAEGAPEPLVRMAEFVGDWDLEVERAGEEPAVARGIARVTYMNRGHGIMERTRVAEYADGRSRATLSFLAVSERHGVWTFGEADSFREAIDAASGGFVAAVRDGGEGSERLVLHQASRPRGGWQLVLTRRTYAPEGEGRYVVEIEESTDLGESWSIVETRRYERRPNVGGFFPVRTDTGRPAASRPEAAAQFDFLVGRFRASHWRASPDGSEARWQSEATAVYALDGHAVLEFDAFDTDPDLPDAATSLVRLYNRAERRWESLFLANRANSVLYFGGVQESDEIVLTFSEADSAGPISRWIFYDVRPDAYRWKGLLSHDRGETFRPTWTIDFERLGASDGDPTPDEEDSAPTAGTSGPDDGGA